MGGYLKGMIKIDSIFVDLNEHIRRPRGFLRRHYFNCGYRDFLAKGHMEIT